MVLQIYLVHSHKYVHICGIEPSTLWLDWKNTACVSIIKGNWNGKNEGPGKLLLCISILKVNWGMIYSHFSSMLTVDLLLSQINRDLTWTVYSWKETVWTSVVLFLQREHISMVYFFASYCTSQLLCPLFFSHKGKETMSYTLGYAMQEIHEWKK